MRKVLFVFLVLVLASATFATPFRLFGKKKLAEVPADKIALPEWAIQNIEVVFNVKYDEKTGKFIGQWSPPGKSRYLVNVATEVVYQCKISKDPGTRDTFDCTYQRVDMALPIVDVVPYGYSSGMIPTVSEDGGGK